MATWPVNAWPLETRHGFINVRIAKGPAAVTPGMRRDLARLSPSCHRETALQSQHQDTWAAISEMDVERALKVQRMQAERSQHHAAPRRVDQGAPARAACR
jgi:hypothetical protein